MGCVTESVFVVCTGRRETKAAVQVAHELSQALRQSLTIVDFQVVRYPLRPREPRPSSPARDQEFCEWLRHRDPSANVRRYVCANPRDAFGLVFPPRSLVVVGGTKRLWPTKSTRMRDALAAAGHRVVYIDEAIHAS